MNDEILFQLQRALDAGPARRFFVADGMAPLLLPGSAQPYDRLLFVLGGVKREPLSLDGKVRKVELGPGDAYLMPRGVFEHSALDSAQQLLCIVLRGGYLRVSYYDLPGPVPRLPWPSAAFIHTERPVPGALTHIIEALKSVPEEAARSLLCAALLMVLAECRASSAPPGKAQHTFERLRSHVSHHFAEPLTREDVAALFGLNPNYVSAVFRELGGTTFQAYLIHCRIERARTLLLCSDLPIKTVAETSGFGNEVYFIRRFREIVGLPPGAYRRSGGFSGGIG